MKILTVILTILMLTGCADSKNPVHHQAKIAPELVDDIYIKKELYGKDSIRLNKEQTELFVKEWNNAAPKGLYKMRPGFWLILKLKNDSVRKFKTNKNLIKEKNDWTYSISDSTLISSFWKRNYPFEKPENYNPISFIKEVSSTLKTERDTLRIGITMIGEFPVDWVKEEHIQYLFSVLKSKEVCECYINPLSSHLPLDDFAEKGGYAALFLQAYKENRKVESGLYACPKIDKKLNAELKEWRKEKK